MPPIALSHSLRLPRDTRRTVMRGKEGFITPSLQSGENFWLYVFLFWEGNVSLRAHLSGALEARGGVPVLGLGGEARGGAGRSADRDPARFRTKLLEIPNPA